MPSSGKRTFSGWVITPASPFLHHVASVLVRTKAEQTRVTQLPVYRPLDEGNLDDDLGPHPVCAQAWKADGLREWRFRHLEAVESGAEVQQQLRVEPRADLPREHELVVLEIPDEQCTQADSAALGICESADDELLGELAFHLEPVR